MENFLNKQTLINREMLQRKNSVKVATSIQAVEEFDAWCDDEDDQQDETYTDPEIVAEGMVRHPFHSPLVKRSRDGKL
jgi:hypothetical protein